MTGFAGTPSVLLGSLTSSDPAPRPEGVGSADDDTHLLAHVGGTFLTFISEPDS